MGRIDLHCHLLYGVDDGAKTLEDSLEMARALVDLGYTHVAPSPHHRPQYAPRDVAAQRLDEVRAALREANIPLELATNAENYLFDDRFLSEMGTKDARLIGAGAYVLVEAPYTAPVPALTDLIFRVKLKGITPVFAHPERCLEFEREGRAEAAIRAGALLQLDVGALMGRYGPVAKKLSRRLLDEGLYALCATDLHGPTKAREWVGKSLDELRSRAGERAFLRLTEENPARILHGEALET